MKTSHRVAGGLALLAAVALGLLYRLLAPSPVPVSAVPPAAPAPEERMAGPPEAAPSAAAALASAAASTIEPPAETTPLTTAGIGEALERLIGRKAVLTFLQLDDFPRRVVATVDNLGRERAPTMVWPVLPTGGRFTVLQHNGATTISPDNGLRYTPLVLLVESVNIGHAVDLYARMYPLLQDAYAELGYPNRSFNDRLLEVIDLLLATPEPTTPVKLDLLEIKGPVPSQRPWVHYRFADPAFESLAAGQKMLIRTGPVNERRLKAKLLEFRQHIAARSSR